MECTLKVVRSALDEYRFDEASQAIYKFYWNEFCDWYIEMSKFDLKNDEVKPYTVAVLVYILEKACTILSPLMPFITEHIFSQINRDENKISLMVSDYPNCNDDLVDLDIEKEFTTFMDIVSYIRNSRATFNIALNKKLDIEIHYSNDYTKKIIEEYKNTISNIALVERFEVLEVNTKEIPKGSFVRVFDGGKLVVNLYGIVDIEQEKKRLEKEKSKYESDLNAVDKKLKNENFMSKASKEAIETENRKYREFKEKLNSISDILSSL